jgi:hypothetical protein
MRAGLVIETIKGIKQTSIHKQMYEMSMFLRDIEKELGSHYSFDEEVNVVHFTELLQVCSDKLPEDQSLLLKPILRELKLNQLL